MAVQFRHAIAPLVAMGALASVPARAYWEIAPEVSAGMLRETNVRYVESGGSSVSGTYTDLTVNGSWKWATGTATFRPQFREVNYVQEAKDLNDSDTTWSFGLSQSVPRGSLALQLAYQKADIQRTGVDQNIAIVGPIVDQTQYFVAPSFRFILSPLNRLTLTGSFADTEYDDKEPGFRGYLDYTYATADLALEHLLSTRSSFYVGLNTGTFDADAPDSPITNRTDSFGFSATYERSFAENLTGTVSLGATRSDVSVQNRGDPRFAPTRRTSDETLVGSVGVARRTADMTTNVQLSRSTAPRSDGTKVEINQFLVSFSRPLGSQLSTLSNFRLFDESAIGLDEVLDRRYFAADVSLRWQFVQNWFIGPRIEYTDQETDIPATLIAIGPPPVFVPSRSVSQSNIRFYFGVQWNPRAWRRP